MLHLDLSLHPEDAARLARVPEIGGVRGRPSPFHVIWHDTPSAALANAGFSLAEQRQGHETVWRLERMRPASDAVAEDAAETAVWAPGTRPPLVVEAADLAGIDAAAPDTLPEPLLPVAGFDGHVRVVNGGAVTLTVLSGELRAVVGQRTVCRVGLDGEAASVAPLAHALAGTLRLSVPPMTFAAEAYATARPPPAPRRLGAPALPPHLGVGEAFAYVVAHLADVILHYAPRIRAGEAPEPVHQMRVAVRRLRSAMQLFRKVAGCAELDEAETALKLLGQALGPARDWDVFTTGTARTVGAAFAEDASVTRLVRQAKRRREAAYVALDAYLDSPAFRQLGLSLATLAASRPWERPPIAADAAPPADADVAGADTVTPGANFVPLEPPVAAPAEPDRGELARYAARALGKRLARVIAPGDDIRELPAADLHAIRLNAKRLRYAAEFFAPLFPGRETRRFVRRLTTLQERLGHLNDGHVAADLLAEIRHAHSHAGGIVLGFIAAGTTGTRAKIDRTWRKFVRQGVFWE